MQLKVMVILLALLAWSDLDLVRAGEDGKARSWSDRERVSYSVGYQIGTDLKSQNKAIDPVAVRQGLKDVLANAPALPREEMSGVIRDLQDKILISQKASPAKSRRQSREEYRDAGRKFLAANAKEDGVISRPSGLQYKIIEPGTGKHPGLDDTVVLRYRGTTIDGREFYDTERRGGSAKIRIKDTVPGLREALVLMREGAHWQLFVPESLAYGERGPLADQTVIFDLELLSIE